MPREIVAAAEDRITRLSGLWVGLGALVVDSIVAGGTVGRGLCIVRGRGWSRRRRRILRRSTVGFATMLLKFKRSVEARVAVWSGACVMYLKRQLCWPGVRLALPVMMAGSDPHLV